jgi:hypothetical protein
MKDPLDIDGRTRENKNKQMLVRGVDGKFRGSGKKFNERKDKRDNSKPESVAFQKCIAEIKMT